MISNHFAFPQMSAILYTIRNMKMVAALQINTQAGVARILLIPQKPLSQKPTSNMTIPMAKRAQVILLISFLEVKY